MIRSENNILLFHWNEDQLLTSQLKLEDENNEDKNWVSIILETRDEMSFNLENLCQFLVRSVVFTSNLKDIKLIVNQNTIFHIVMDRNVSVPLSNNFSLSKSFMCPGKYLIIILNYYYYYYYYNY